MQAIRPYWFTRLARLWPFGHFWLGLVIFLVLGGVLGALFGLFGEIEDPSSRLGLLGICLFFAFINAVGLAGTTAIINRMESALDQLRPLLRVDDEKFAGLRASLSGATSRRLWTVGLISLAIGTVHHQLLIISGTSIGNEIPLVGVGFGTLLTWFVLVHVISALTHNAHVFARLGRDATSIDILRPQQLAPFGTIALLPSLALMGTQLVYPLLSLNGQFNAYATLPGFLLTLLSAVYLLLRPTWPVHVHMREAKSSLLASTEAGIARWRGSNTDRNFTPEAVSGLVPILDFRQHVRALPEWPFDLGLIGRWLFYIVIPPLTWVLAALMETIVDGFLS